MPRHALYLAIVTAFWSASVAAQEALRLRVHPAAIQFTFPEASEQLLVFGVAPDGQPTDATRSVQYSTTVVGIVEVSSTGQIVPRSDGRTEILVQQGGEVARVPVEVQGTRSPPPISFARDIIPILSKAGCNSGGCHGKAEGQNGFKLSVFGYDAAADRRAIAIEARGRRVFPAVPEQSLLLLKATAQVPHGGGQKFEAGSIWHRRMVRWIVEGMQTDSAESPPPAGSSAPPAGLVVVPAEVTLGAQGAQQLRVTMRQPDGSSRCVTAEAEYQSNQEAIAGVSRQGLIEATDVPGEAAILVRYLGHVGVCRVTRPRSEGQFTRPAERNFIDRLVWNKLERLRIAPSPPADDATYLRRVYLDTIGTLPTVAEVQRILADPSPDKRQRVVSELFGRKEYADYWAQRWSDLLRVDKDTITPQGAVAMTRWLRDQMQRNVPYDQFARTILTAEGSTFDVSPAAFYQAQGDAETLARSVSQLFFGVRIECAQCHHHPFERWDQQDYYALAGFFTGLERKPHPLGGLKIVSGAGTDLKHPRSGAIVPAAGLGAPPAELPKEGDRRQALAVWALRPENPFFTRTIANRLWAHYFGRGLVEPIDDLRATNPASNEALLDALAAHLVEVRYDLQAFTRTLLDSQAYQLSAEPLESNRLDEQNYSRAAWKPLPAEVLLDAISQVTGVPEAFNGWPRGYRAIEVWDNKLPSEFMEVFGRPSRLTVCACERNTEPSIAQALHLLNAPATAEKVQHRDGYARRLANSDKSPEAVVEELYLATLSRPPSAAERQVMLQAFDGVARREAVEDVLWTLLNTREFVFNH